MKSSRVSLEQAANRPPLWPLYPLSKNIAARVRAIYMVKQLKAQPTRISDYRQGKRSDTLALLASGASINQLTDSQWNFISEQCDSFGFNNWLLHPFVPTYYVGEFPRDALARRRWIENLTIRAADYYDRHVSIKRWEKFPAETRQLMSDSRMELSLAWSPNIGGNSERTFARNLRFWDSLGLYRSDIALWNKASSLDYLIQIGFRARYKSIILCGVDLSDINYFYEHRPIQDFARARGLAIPPSGQTARTHKTFDSSRVYGGVPIDRVIFHLRAELLDAASCRLFVANESSALYPALPLHPAFRQ